MRADEEQQADRARADAEALVEEDRRAARWSGSRRRWLSMANNAEIFAQHAARLGGHRRARGARGGFHAGRQPAGRPAAARRTGRVDPGPRCDRTARDRTASKPAAAARAAAASREPPACPISCSTLYWRKSSCARDRWWSRAAAACSTTSAAPRSRPMPLTMPMNAATPSVARRRRVAPAQRAPTREQSDGDERAAPPEAVAEEGDDGRRERRARESEPDDDADGERGQLERREIDAEQHAHHAGRERTRENGEIQPGAVLRHRAHISSDPFRP